MKTFLRTVFLALACWSSAQAADKNVKYRSVVPQAEDVAKAGNHREAVDLLKSFLADPSADSQDLATALNITVESLKKLGGHQEAENAIEAAAKVHAKNWRVLQTAAFSIRGMVKYGRILDGKFERGQRPDSGSTMAHCTARDRVRSLQLLMAARAALPADASKYDKRGLYQTLYAAWLNDSSPPWKLQLLTDLKVLPEPEQGYPGYRDRTNQGYPVDAEGNPVFFKLPASYEAAANDGECMRLALSEWEDTLLAKYTLAHLAKGWFGAQSLGRAPVVGDDEAKQQTSLSALHTLAENETVVRLATGPKRFKLPPDYDFIRLLREVTTEGADNKDAYYVSNAFSDLTSELINRRQFEAAVVELKRAIAREKNKVRKKTFIETLAQITDNLGSILPGKAQPEGSKAELTLVFRNATKVSFSARAVDVAKLLSDTKAYLKSESKQLDWERANLSQIGQQIIGKKGDKYLAVTVAAWSEALEPADHHWDKQVLLHTPLTKAGAYLVEGRFEGGRITRALIWIHGITLVESRVENAIHYFVCDAVTGAPVPRARLAFFGYRQEWKNTGVFTKSPGYVYQFKEFSDTANDKGELKVTNSRRPEGYQWVVSAQDDQGRTAFSGVETSYYYADGSNGGDVTSEPRIYTITDRPVYRPGQEVKWKIWARKVGYDPKLDTNGFKGKWCEVTITNDRNEKVLEKTYHLDDSGAVEDMVKLGDDATLGAYNIHFTLDRNNGPYGDQSFRVEEYKKPEFEVKIDSPEMPVALGDSFEIKIKADYYFGGPVKEGKVKYKVSRSPHSDHWYPSGRWDWLFGPGYNWSAVTYDWYPNSRYWSRCIVWWPWMQRGHEPPEVVAEGESAIGADGTVKVKIDTALAKELHGDEDHSYSIEAEVTDNSRRTIVGNSNVLASRRAFETYAWLDRGWYETGGAATVRIESRTIDGKAIAATGKLRVIKLSYDKDGAPHEDEAASFDIKTNGSEAAQQVLKWSSAGQYRLAVQLKDAAAHESETSIFTTVRGEGLKTQSFRFDDLEVVTEKDEYQPGEEVEVQINTNRPGSTVALFVRAEKYTEPAWLTLDGKTASYRFRLGPADQPNIFLEAYTVSNAALHKVTRQLIVPPSKRISTVELTTSKPTYLPRDKASAKLLVKDQDGNPFVGQVVITAYDKALEYISGGSNQGDIRPFFWGWKRSYYSQINTWLRATESGLLRQGEKGMTTLGYSNAWGLGLSGFNTYTGGTTLSLGTLDMNGTSGGVLGVLAGDAAAPAAAAPMAAAGEAPRSEGFVKSGTRSKTSAADPFGGGAAAPNAPAMIRSNLADSAVWVASATTNAAGEATIDFAMPDNLTTWKLKSWVMGNETQVGEAAVEVITRKDVMVRLQAPRFFIEKDEVVISANVHNELDQEQNVEAILEVDGQGAMLTAIDGGKLPSFHQAIAAHAEQRFDWRLKVTGAGKVVVRAKALAKGDSDAMEMTFPVYEHGVLRTDSWSLGLKPDQASGSLSFTVPAERKPEMTRLELRYSPTLAMALVDALPYLADYPYGCTEQTLSRFVPTVVTLGALKNLGIDLKQVREKRVNLNAQEIGDAKKRGQRWQGKNNDGNPKEAVFDEDEVNKRARAGVQRLEAMRNKDGGWGWFPGGEKSSTHMTALVARGLLTAKDSGLKFNTDLLDSALTWLQRHEANEALRLQLPEKHRNHKASPDDEDALVHSALAHANQSNATMHKALYENRDKLSHYNLALLGLACVDLKKKDERDMCLRNLRQFLKQDDENQTAWLDFPQSGWWYWYDDPIETQAAFLRLLVAAEPKSDEAPRVAKYLLNNRRNGTYWNSTRDTAAVIEALAVFMKASGEQKPNMQLNVVIDGVVKKHVSITAENLFSFDGSVVLEGDEVATGKHTIEFRKQGKSPLYANAYLTLYSKEDMIPAAGLEVKVERRFYKLTEEMKTSNVSGSRGQVLTQQGIQYKRTELASGDALKSGDLVEVELSIESKNDYEYILIADPKPAGFEPVEVRSGWNYQGLHAYQEFRDEKVAFFAERLPKGRHNLSYRVRAEIPGHFSALPTKAEAMYSPELRGNAKEWKAEIGEAK